MEKRIILFALLFAIQINYSQKTVKMTSEYGAKNRELEEVLSFENIGLETLKFESNEIKGKYYEINIKEFKNGKIVNTKNLFKGNDSEYFIIDSTFTSFKFFTKMENNKLKTYLKGNRFGSRQEYFDLELANGKYVLKDFQGTKKFLYVPLDKEFPILAIITATKHKDGSGSYCEVAQSEIAPEKFGEKFNIPHYFIVYMKFI
jgi:hypothetical protein